MMDRESSFSNIIQTIVNEGDNLQEARDIPNYEKLLKELVSIDKSTKKLPNRFNALIKILSDFNDERIDEMAKHNKFIFEDGQWDYQEYKRDAYKMYLDKNYDKKKQAFLSYAFEDKLYTIALFFFFQNNNIFLYIDWMNNGKEKEGIILKESLDKALNESDYLVFLRTPNSELKIGGNYYIRPWCAWELGNFYDKQGAKEKFYIDLYDHKKIDNLQLAGVRKLINIKYGVLEGEL